MNADRIVSALLENEEEDDFDVKSFIKRHHSALFDGWVQVDGDVDWWEYGGTFHNQALNMMLHVPGIEGAGLKDWSSWDITLKPEDVAAIEAQFPVNVDPEWPEGGDQNEREREDAIERRKEEIAQQRNDNRKQPCERWLDDHFEDYADYIQDMEEQAGEDITDWPLGAKWAFLGQIIGFHEFDDMPDKYTYAEIDAYLQPREDFRGKSRQQHQLPDAP